MVECGCGCDCGLEESNGAEGMHPLNKISEFVQEVCVKNEHGYRSVFLVRGKGNMTECRCDADSGLSPTESSAETHMAHRQAERVHEYKAMCSVWVGVFEAAFWTNQGPHRSKGGNKDDHSKHVPYGHESNRYHPV